MLRVIGVGWSKVGLVVWVESIVWGWLPVGRARRGGERMLLWGVLGVWGLQVAVWARGSACVGAPVGVGSWCAVLLSPLVEVVLNGCVLVVVLPLAAQVVGSGCFRLT